MSLRQQTIKQLTDQLIQASQKLNQLHKTGSISIEGQVTNLGEPVDLEEIAQTIELTPDAEEIDFLESVIDSHRNKPF